MSTTKSIFNTFSVLLVVFAILAVQVRHVLADSDIVPETDRPAFEDQDPSIDKPKYDGSTENQDCPSTGLMWVNGPFEPEIAAQAQQSLAEIGIDSNIEARGYGEIDNCGSYSQHGVDFTVSLLQSDMSVQSTDQELANEVLPILTTLGKPTLGNVTVIDSMGGVIPLITPDDASNDLQTLDVEQFPADAIFKKVYVIVYDPLMSNGQKLSEYKHWNSHSVITQQTIDFFKQTSGNKLNYSVVDTTVVTNGWPELTDGFSYTETEYLAVVAGQQTPHNPSGVNYNKIVNSAQFDICGKLNRGEIDEVWVYNGPWFGFYESTLVGPGAYYFNSTPVSGSHGCNRLVPIMGPSVERTKDESVHNFTHRTESTMKKVYGSWLQNNTSHNWNKFGLVKAQSPDYTYSGCGSSHFPPNATSDYNYANVTPVLSNCDDFINYPSLGDPLQVSQPVTCSSWGCNSFDYYAYWFGHFPPYSGCGPDNVANDWWNYVAEPGFALYPSNACQTNMHVISGNAGSGSVSLTYTDGTQKTVSADIYGNYFLMVSDQWSGTITPTKDGGYIFDPRNYTDVQSDLYNQEGYTFLLNGPEINIKGNNILINDGDSTPALTDYTNFGNVQIAGGSVSRTFTIYNTGPGNLNLMDSPQVTISGTHASDFSVTVQPASLIVPSGSTAFTVVFDPGTTGLKTASISIANDDSNEYPYNFSIQGMGDINEMDIKGNNVSILDGDGSPSSTDYTHFGSIPVAGGSVSRTFTIYNTGGSDLNLTDSPRVTVSGTHASDFSVTVQPSSPIAPSGSTTFTVVFDPSAGVAARTASISIANDDSNENPYNFSIGGTATINPEIDIQGNSVSIVDGDTTPSLTDHTDFGSVSTASGAASRTFTIYNLGDGDLTLTGSKVIVSGTNSSDFTVTVMPSTPIVPGGSTTFTIAFSPTGSGLRTASLSIYSTDSNENPHNFSVQGMATVPEMNVQGKSITISDGDSSPYISDDTDFGSMAVAGGTTSHTFTISNTGNSDLNLGDSPKVVISGTHASDFSITAQPVSPIIPSGSATFTVVFDPGGSGVRTASISIVNDDPNENPYNFSIQGVGITFPEIDIQGNNVSILNGDVTPSLTDHTDFGNTALAGGTVSHTFTIHNTGDGALMLPDPGVSVTGANSSDFTVTMQPSTSILPGGSTTFTIVFDPAGSGLRSASLSVISDDLNETPYNFAVRGMGATFPEMDVQGNNVSIPDGDTAPSLADHTDFGSTPLAGGTISRTFTIYNNGDGDLDLTDSLKVTLSGTHASDFSITVQPSSPIAPTDSRTFTVVFDPGAGGVRTASISIADNDPNENPYNFSIQGTSDISPEMGIDGNNVLISDGDSTPSTTDHTNFGSIPVAAGSVSRTFMIYNTGVGDLNLTNSPKVVISGTHASDFSVTVQPSSPIAPTASVTFTVVFNPGGSGSRTASISIANNDSNENPYNFSILGTGTTFPEIDIHGNNVSILDGDTTPSLTDHTDFGTTPLTGGLVSRTFTIHNVGDGDLTLTGSPSKVLVSGTNSPDFTVTSQPASPIAPGGSTTFMIAFDPAGSGLRTATLSVYSDDSNENPHDFFIAGTGITFPEIDIQGNSVSIPDGDATPSLVDHTNFGSTPLAGGTISRTFTIKNIGDGSLTLTGSPGKVLVSGINSSAFTVTLQPSSPIAPGGSTTFTVVFVPRMEGLHTALISIPDNDSNENPYDFSVQGIGTGEDPHVLSIIRVNGSPTAANIVNYTVAFSESVTDVSADDFNLTTSGVSAATVSGVSGSGNIYTVTVRTGSGDGTLRLDVADNDSIMDGASNPLGGINAGNGNFTTGESYAIIKTLDPKLSAPVLRSPQTNLVINNTVPTFWWSAVRGGQTYEIVFATDNAFMEIEASKIVNGLSHTIVSPLGDGKYYWRVRAYNGSSQPGKWSLSRTVTIDTTGPVAPLLSSPADNAPSNRTPTFNWISTPNAVLYEFQYDDDPGFINPIYTASVRGTFRKPPAMKPGTYYWRVRAKDAAGNWGEWSIPYTVSITGP